MNNNEYILDKIVNELRVTNLRPNMICLNFYTYNLLEEQIQEIDINYNSPTIEALQQIKLVIDQDLQDMEIKIVE